LATAYGDGSAAKAFVSPSGTDLSIDAGDPTEVKLDDCGLVYFADGELSVTLIFKYGWNATPAATSPAVDEYPEDVFWKALKKNFASYNLGFVTCDGDLGYFMNADETTFAKGQILVKDLSPEVINDCLTISGKEVTLRFKCGASMKRIATLLDGDHDELVAWA